ncbi:MAG: DUF1330 domain-containing protein [Halieaceae bacterium]
MNKEEIESATRELMELAHGGIEPSREQVENLLSGDLEGPFHFVNLLAFKQAAAYPSDHELASEQLSGSDAYDKYGEVAMAHVIKRGGRLITLNNVEKQVIGSSRAWHRVATMEYQNIKAFVDMLLDPEYQAALVHRDSGLEATEVFVTRPLITQPIG